jgi:preprotein translocase subunit SecG
MIIVVPIIVIVIVMIVIAVILEPRRSVGDECPTAIYFR